MKLASVDRYCMAAGAANIACHRAELVAAVVACSRNWFREHRVGRVTRNLDSVDAINFDLVCHSVTVADLAPTQGHVPPPVTVNVTSSENGSQLLNVCVLTEKVQLSP